MTQIYITQLDLDRLNKLLDRREPHDEYDKALIAELSESKIINPKSVPSDVITMNSLAMFSEESGKSREYQLVFPEDADLAQNKISVLSPVGYSIIGNRVGSTVSIPTPKGRKELKVEKIVYQPERSGNFEL